MKLPEKAPSKKYEKITLTDSAEIQEEVEYQRFILHLDENLINAFERYVFEEKMKGEVLMDIKTGKLKKINRSLLCRKILSDFLREKGVEID